MPHRDVTNLTRQPEFANAVVGLAMATAHAHGNPSADTHFVNARNRVSQMVRAFARPDMGISTRIDQTSEQAANVIVGRLKEGDVTPGEVQTIIAKAFDVEPHHVAEPNSAGQRLHISQQAKRAIAGGDDVFEIDLGKPDLPGHSGGPRGVHRERGGR